MRRIIPIVAAFSVLSPVLTLAEGGATFDAAAAFGARPSSGDLSLSPDGQNLAWIAPAATGQGAVVYSLNLAGKDAKPKAVISVSGSPERMESCDWVSNERLVCKIYLLQEDPRFGRPLLYTRFVAVNTDGSNLKALSNQQTERTHGLLRNGGTVIDWLPGTEGSVLLERGYRPNDQVGTRMGSTDVGLGVDLVDTRTLQTHRVEPPRRDAVGYISDGAGHVRIVETVEKSANGLTGLVEYEFHPVGSEDLQPLSTFRTSDESGFQPVAVDPESNLAYGFKRLDGRFAIYTMALDSGRAEQLVYANPQVDVSRLILLGRQRRVVGVDYYTDYRHTEYFAPDVKALIDSASHALHTVPHLVSASVDGNRVLVQSSTDVDPGVYYLFDRKSHQLQTLFVVRNQLEGVKLATVRPVTYPAGDGTQIPGYLTLPAGVQSVKGLPAIVMPHGGGPNTRDVWGFDWLAQFFANRGYVVFQPNFRGSWGYGDAWLRDNGFRAWKVAIGDALDAGRWLVKEGADPARLGIVGWSYGGYIALQSAVVDPAVFKAVIGIAPVTDLPALLEQNRRWSDFGVTSDFIGGGANAREGSPAEHADRIKVPVLLFHGGMDAYASIEQSRLMESALKSAGGNCTLVTWGPLDGRLDDSAARTEMLSRSDAFLRAAFGM
jgi:dipeptidyl aminopeptidase/acylaminoacyl peptidase